MFLRDGVVSAPPILAANLSTAGPNRNPRKAAFGASPGVSPAAPFLRRQLEYITAFRLCIESTASHSITSRCQWSLWQRMRGSLGERFLLPSHMMHLPKSRAIPNQKIRRLKRYELILTSRPARWGRVSMQGMLDIAGLSRLRLLSRPCAP